MINDRATAERVLGAMFPDLGTPAPWDIDEDYTLWVYEWYTDEDHGHGLCADVGGGYTVGIDNGDSVESYGGILEALQAIKRNFVNKLTNK